MDILFIGPLPPFPGGSAFIHSDILLGLAARGHSIRSIAAIYEGEAADDFAASHPELRIRRMRMPAYLFGTNPLPSPEETRLEAEAIRAATLAELRIGRPDVVFLGREWVGVPIVDLLIDGGIPYVALGHGSVLYALAKNALPEPLAGRLCEVFRHAARSVAVSRGLGARLGDLGLANAVVIENSVDLTLFRPLPRSPELQARLGIAAGDVVVAHSSNLKRVKRPLDIVESAARALPSDRRLLYLICGDGDLRPEMEAACRRLGVAERFRFAGWVDHPRLPGYLNLADLVVSASESEGRSLACLEAQACGCVLIASDIPASSDLVEDSVTGLLFRTGDVDDLTARTLLAAADPALRGRIGRNAVAARQREGGIRRVVDEYERVLLEAANPLVTEPRP